MPPAPIPTAPPALPDMICFAIYSASHAMQRIYQPILSKMGLTYPQYLVMIVLWSQDNRSVGDLARALQLDTNTLTPLLKRMEAQGLLTRTRSTEDERQVRVTLTEKGWSLRPLAAEATACIFDRAGLAVEELTAIRDAVAELRDRLRVPA